MLSCTIGDWRCPHGHWGGCLLCGGGPWYTPQPQFYKPEPLPDSLFTLDAGVLKRISEEIAKLAQPAAAAPAVPDADIEAMYDADSGDA